MEQKIEEFAEKAMQAKSPDEVEAAAKECGEELTDEALDAVAGGKSVIIKNIVHTGQNHGGMA